MASRKTRTRRTADKMAAYKAAASSLRQPPLTRPSSSNSSNGTIPTRRSPRSSPNASEVPSAKSPRGGGSRRIIRGDVSPCGSVQKPKEHENRTEEPAVKNGRTDGALSEKDKAALNISLGDGSPNNRGKSGVIEFDPDEIIPETPEPVPVARSRKRIVAPLGAKISEAFSPESHGAEKSAKKRRLFSTPPKKNFRDALDDVAPEEASNRASTAALVEGYRSQELDSPVSADDDLLTPPLANTRNAPSTSVPARRTQGSVFFQKDRPLGESHRVRAGRLIASKTDRGRTERSVGTGLSLDMMATSSATISRMFEGFARKVVKDIGDMRRAHLDEMRKMSESLNETMTSEIRNIQGLFEMISGTGMNGARALSGSTTSLKEWERKLDGLTPYSTVIFGKELFSRILSFNAPLKVVDTYRKYRERGVTDVERCSLSAQTLLFRLQRTDKKFQYLDDIGKLHSDFKFSVVRNAFYNVHLDSFGLFNEKTSTGKENESSKDDMNTCSVRGKIDRPAWLEKGNVSIDHIVEARAFTETPGQSRKGKVRHAPTTDDISCHGALRVYRQLGKILHGGRSNLRMAFFQGLGYLLVPWGCRFGDIDQNTMKISFCEDEDPFQTNLDILLDEIPIAKQCVQNADQNTVNAVDISNKKMLKDLFSQWRDMILTADHEVLVSSPGQQPTAQSNFERKQMHRLINLIDVALDCCVEFCRVGSREIFLRSSKNSFRCVMVFAVLFKAICLEFMRKCGKPTDSSVTNVPEPTDVKVYGTCLKDLIPGLSTQKSILMNKCLQIPMSVYDTFNHVGTEEEVGSEACEGVGSILDLNMIEESAEDGVMAI